VDVVLGYRLGTRGWVPFAVRQKIRVYENRRGEQRLDRQKAEDFDPEREAGRGRREFWKIYTREQRAAANRVVKEIQEAWEGPRFVGWWHYNPVTGKFERRKVDVFKKIKQDVFRTLRMQGVFDRMEAMVDPMYAAEKVMEGYASLTGGGTYRDPGPLKELPVGRIPYGEAGGYLGRYLEKGSGWKEPGMVPPGGTPKEIGESLQGTGMEYLFGRGRVSVRELARFQGVAPSQVEVD
jgi:hypothetical protein